MNSEQVVILAGRRTPFGKLCGALKDFPAPVLGGFAIRAALADAELDARLLNGVYMGEAYTAGVGQNPARQAAIYAGVPWNVPAETFGKVCASSVAALAHAVNQIRLGHARFMIAGGMESMSRAPYLANRVKKEMGDRPAAAGELLADSMLDDGLRDEYPDDRPHMGAYANLCASEKRIGREEQDDFAHESLVRALRAEKEGLFGSQIIPIDDSANGVINSDEGLLDSDGKKRVPDREKMRQMKPVAGFKYSTVSSTVTIATSSQISDGAAALVIAAEHRFAKARDNPPALARIVSIAVHSGESEWYTTAPVGAIKKILHASGLYASDIGLFGINEAFAVVPLYAMRELDIPHEKVNIWGGAIAIGHPLGASGARIILSLAHQLIHTHKRYGIAAICNGGGEAMAVLIENLRL